MSRSKRPRLACLLIPLFPLAARLRSHPELLETALVICEGNGPAAHVIAATRKARRQGIQAGMTLAQARSLLPELLARPRDPECEHSTQQTLLEIAERFSPRVEDAAEGVVYLDLDDESLQRHFGAPSSPETDSSDTAAASPPTTGTGTTGQEGQKGQEGQEQHPEICFAQAAMRAAQHQGLVLRVGIASSKLAAGIAARQPHSPTRVSAGDEAEFLAPLKLPQLAPEAGVATTLSRWGIRTIGAFAMLPADEVSSRLGEVGHQLHLKARGLDSQPFVPYRPPEDFQEGLEFDWPLVSLEPLLFVLRAGIDRVCRRLEASGLGCQQLGYSLRLEPDGHHERRITLPAPTRETKTLLTLVRLQLEAEPPGAPVTAYQLSALPDRPRTRQLTLFGSPDLAPDRLATTLARLFALLGEDRIGSPRTVDGHRTERFSICEFSAGPLPERPPKPRHGKGLLAVRTLRPMIPVEVLTREEQQGLRPFEVHSNATEESRSPRIDGKVVVASGPWHQEEQWWAAEAIEREYWDIELANGGLYRVFRDLHQEQWFVDGVYD